MEGQFKDPDTLAKFEILDRVGQYPPVYTYLARRQSGSDEKFLIKYFDTSLLADDPRGFKRTDVLGFVCEIVQISSSNIPGVCKSVFAKDKWIAFEYIHDMTLQKAVKYNGLYTISDALEVCSKVGRVLSEVEKQDALHLALNPKNVFVSKEGEVTVKGWLADQSNLEFFSDPQKLVYDPYYFQAPELLDLKGVSPASDIYSLGLLACYLMTGDWEVKSKLKTGEGLPKETSVVLKDLLQEDASRRVQDWDDALEILGRPSSFSAGPIPDKAASKNTPVPPVSTVALATIKEAQAKEPTFFLETGDEDGEVEAFPEEPQVEIAAVDHEADEDSEVGAIIAEIETEQQKMDDTVEKTDPVPEETSEITDEAGEEPDTDSGEDLEEKDNTVKLDPASIEERLEEVFSVNSESEAKDSSDDEHEKEDAFASFVPHREVMPAPRRERPVVLSRAPAGRVGELMSNRTFMVTAIAAIALALIASVAGLIVSFSPNNTKSSAQPLLVPSFVGMSYEQAQEQASGAGVTLTKDETWSDQVPAGQVISQSPEADTEIADAMICTLAVSKGPEPTTEDPGTATPEDPATPSQPSGPDTGSNTGTTPAPAQPAHGKPHVSVSASPSSGPSSGVMVTLSASASVDGGSIVSYSWSCGGSGPHTSHEFASNVAPTTFTVTCTVTDDLGQTAKGSASISLY